MAWLYVFLAGIVEVLWVVGLRYSDNVWQWAGTISLIVAGFYLMIKACTELPSGTVYTVFTGMGATGIVIIDSLVIQTEFALIKFILIGLIVTGVFGLKLTAGNKNIKE